MSEKPKILFAVQYATSIGEHLRTIPHLENEAIAFYICLGMLLTPGRVPLRVLEYGGGEDIEYLWEVDEIDYLHVTENSSRYQEELVSLWMTHDFD